MTFRATQQVVLSGVAAANNAASGGGDTFTPTDRTFLMVFALGGVDTTVTIVTPNTSIGGTTIDDLTVTIPSGGGRLIGPFPREHFADPTTGLAAITWSATTGVVFSVFTI